MGLFLLLGGGWISPAQAQQQASFNCANAAGPDEQIICAAPQLRSDDAQLASAYRAALAANPGVWNVLIADQRAWIRTRDGMCGVDRLTNIRDASGAIQPRFTACFVKHYHARLLYLQALTMPTTLVGPSPGGPGGIAIFTSPGSTVTFNFTPGNSTPGTQAPPPLGGPVNSAQTPGNVRIAQSELLTIAARIRALHPLGSWMDLQTHTDITCQLAANGVFPPAMLQNGPCRSGERDTYPRSPWNSAVTIYAPWADDYGGGAGVFQVDFQLYGIEPNPCGALIGYSLATGQDRGLVRVWTAGGRPIDPANDVAGPLACMDAGFDFTL